jgi:hypothetical protein
LPDLGWRRFSISRSHLYFLLFDVYLLYSPRYQRSIKTRGRFVKWLGAWAYARRDSGVYAYVSARRRFALRFSPSLRCPNLKLMFNTLSPFAIGFPRRPVFVRLPAAIAIFIIAFGDGLVMEGIVRDGCATSG